MQSMDAPTGLHVAIVMDGNGRWATRRSLPRAVGHAAGAEALRRTIWAAPGANIGTLTVFAFSADNWRRPPTEVDALMTLLGQYLARDTGQLAQAGVRLTVIGRRDRLSSGLRAAIEAAEHATAAGTTLWLRVAVDYSAREAIAAAAGSLSVGAVTREALATALAASAPDVDLLIRTGGERRLSDFLLWECAYAELLFTDAMWPDFDAAALAAAMAEFARRDRRFGALAPAARAA